jgi:hypothetical protein
VPNELLGSPAYTGMTMHPDTSGGYAVWLPSDWIKVDLKRNHHGMLFSPYQDDYNTCFLTEKHKLKISVTPDDIPVLRETFHEAIQKLPGVEIESTDESLSDSINMFEARFSFLEGESRRKRWLRNIYWGDGQLVLIAQGRTTEDFEYWLPMFYNSMVTVELL